MTQASSKHETVVQGVLVTCEAVKIGPALSRNYLKTIFSQNSWGKLTQQLQGQTGWLM